MCHARYHGCCRIVVDKNTSFDVNVKLRHNRTVNRQTDGRTDRRMEKRATYVTKSGGQGDVSDKV